MRISILSLAIAASFALTGHAYSCSGHTAALDASDKEAITLAQSHLQPVTVTGTHDHGEKVGDLMIKTPYLRATLPNAPVSAGYLTIKNSGTVSDFLVGGNVDFAGTVEVHEMTMDGDVMKMRKLENGIEIPAGAEVTLKPGGLHLMFMKMEQQLKEGDKHKVTLTFKNAGSVDLMLPVKKVERKGHGHHKSGHGHAGHNHGS